MSANTYIAARLRMRKKDKFVKGISNVKDLTEHTIKENLPRCHREMKEAVKDGYTCIGFNLSGYHKLPNVVYPCCFAGDMYKYLLPEFIKIVHEHGLIDKTYAYLDHSCDNTVSNRGGLLRLAKRSLDDNRTRRTNKKFPSLIIGGRVATLGEYKSLERHAEEALRDLDFNPTSGKQIFTNDRGYGPKFKIIHKANTDMSDLEIFAGLLN